MASKCFFRKYFICFFLFGINSRIPINLPKRIHNRTCSIIPRVLHSIFLCTFLYLMCQNVFNDLKNSFKVLSLKYLMVSTFMSTHKMCFRCCHKQPNVFLQNYGPFCSVLMLFGLILIHFGDLQVLGHFRCDFFHRLYRLFNVFYESRIDKCAM